MRLPGKDNCAVDMTRTTPSSGPAKPAPPESDDDVPAAKPAKVRKKKGKTSG